MFDQAIEAMMNEAKAARKQLSKQPTMFVSRQVDKDMGMYLSNYANCLLNRQIDIFDDSQFLLDGGRLASACTISRGMVETYAFAKLLGKKVEKALDKQSEIEGAEKALEVVLSFTNSSRYKQESQKKLQKGTISIDDIYRTPEAKYRMENMLAGSEHVMNALRDLYEDEMKHKKEKNSDFSVTYDVLSEWVHPSQTSVFHNYVTDAQRALTSVGVLTTQDQARMATARALHFITDSFNIHRWLLGLSKEMSMRS
ncbi:DUF5677 domain-containing protein [Vibrio chagasii]|uniref:DUF5677 domain-containing protein n=1 Tax=Vibrio chagasii TaxID=170679 RepID=UPI002284005C|nr:DUF5677 domain-containing protein [Vibrio chagasii]MCY9824720.1 DUF5677 domain-containing protein [Vibrio chagasii]